MQSERVFKCTSLHRKALNSLEILIKIAELHPENFSDVQALFKEEISIAYVLTRDIHGAFGIPLPEKLKDFAQKVLDIFVDNL